MNRRVLIFNGVWVALALLLGALTVFTSGSVTSGEKLARAQHLLTAFRPEAVTTVTLEKDGQQFVVRQQLETEPGKARQVPEQPAHTHDGDVQHSPDASTSRWQWVQPFQGDAEEASVDQLLRAVQFSTWLRVLDPDAVDRAGFGLDAPSSVLHVDMGDVHYRLRVGGPAPSPAGARYVEVSGENAPNKGVFVVSESTAQDLSPAVENFRVRQMIPYAGSAVDAITFNLDGHWVRWVRLDRHAFRFAELFGEARVDRSAVAQVLLAFARTSAERFVELAEAEELQTAAKKAREPVLELYVTPRGKQTPEARVVVGGACPGAPTLMLIRRLEPRPAAACIAKSSLLQLFKVSPAMVDRALFQVRLDEAERITVTQGERRLELARTGDSFEMRAPSSGPVAREAAESRLTELLEMRGAPIALTDPDKVDLAKYGLDAPRSVVTVAKATSVEAGEEETVELGFVPDPSAPGVQHVYARRKSDGVVLKLGPSAARVFTVDSLLLRPLQLIELASEQLQRIEIQSGRERWALTQPKPSRFELEGPEQVAVSPEPRLADAALAVDLLETVRQLSVERWIAEADDGSYGFGASRLRVQIEGPDAKRWQLTVGARTAGGHFAQLDTLPGVFVVSRRVVQTLLTPLADRSGLVFEAAGLQRVEIVRGAQRVNVMRLGQDWIAQPGTEPLSDASVQALLDALGALRPEPAFAWSENNVSYGFVSPLLKVYLEGEKAGVSEYWSFDVGAATFAGGKALYAVKVSRQQELFGFAAEQIQALLDALDGA